MREVSRVLCVAAMLSSTVVGADAVLGQAPTEEADTAAVATRRDAIGDLNAEAVRAGTFPGAILLPGTNTSLAIGGFLKTVALVDSHMENSGVNLLPGTWGPGIGDDGNFAIDATLARLYFDARAPVARGHIRGHIEWDFNGANSGALGVRPRLVYGEWDTGRGALIAGHNWSAFMDPSIIPESLAEATLSGAVFTRQAQIRWTQRLSTVVIDGSLEDPSAADLFTQSGPVGQTRVPDVVLGAGLGGGGRAHLRAAGIVRRLESSETDTDRRETGWGVHVSGHLNLGERDRLTASAVTGAGIARYVVGIAPLSGGIVDPGTGDVRLLGNRGALVTYRHAWSERTRSTLAGGHAWAEVVAEQPGDPFRSSTYAYLNMLHSPFPYVTLGAEYVYARYATDGGAVTDNHRLSFGFQIF